MIDGHRLVDLHHHGVVHPDDADEVPVAVGKVDRVHLEALRFAVKGDIDHQVALDQLSGDVGLLRVVQVRAEVENEAGFFPGPDEHGDVDSGFERLRIDDVDDGDARRGVLDSEGGRRVIWNRKRAHLEKVRDEETETRHRKNEINFDDRFSVHVGTNRDFTPPTIFFSFSGEK